MMPHDIQILDVLDERNRLEDIEEQIELRTRLHGNGDDNRLIQVYDLNLDDELTWNHNSDHRLLKRGEEMSIDGSMRPIASNDDIQRLTNQLHEKSAMCRSLELQSSHLKLQVQALLGRESHLKAEKEQLMHDNAVKGQDLLLLEAKLRQVAGFERIEGIQLDDLRGKLLELANKRIVELVAIAEAADRKATELEAKMQSMQTQYKYDIEGLTSELKELSDQLAQRTVLYSAQERRWKDSFRSYESLDKEQKIEATFLRGRMQQLTTQTQQIESERMEALIKIKELKQQLQECETFLRDEQTKRTLLDQELSDVMSINIELQSVVDRLRGSEYDELEQDLAADVLKIRTEGRVREEQLLQRLSDAQTRLVAEVATREQLNQEILSLQRICEEQRQLLRDVQASDGWPIPSMATARETIDEDPKEEDFERKMIDRVFFESADVAPDLSKDFEFMFEDKDVDNGDVLLGEISFVHPNPSNNDSDMSIYHLLQYIKQIASNLITSLESIHPIVADSIDHVAIVDRIGEMAVSAIESTAPTANQSSILDILRSMIRYITLRISQEISNNSKANPSEDSHSITTQFLTGYETPQKGHEIDSQGRIDQLEEDIVKHINQEEKLKQIIQEQRAQIAEILRRAATLAPSTAIANESKGILAEEYDHLRIALQKKDNDLLRAQTQLSLLEQQIQIYRDEIAESDAKIAEAYTIATNDIATKYEKRIHEIQQKILTFEERSQEQQLHIDAANLTISDLENELERYKSLLEKTENDALNDRNESQEIIEELSETIRQLQDRSSASIPSTSQTITLPLENDSKTEEVYDASLVVNDVCEESTLQENNSKISHGNDAAHRDDISEQLYDLRMEINDAMTENQRLTRDLHQIIAERDGLKDQLANAIAREETRQSILDEIEKERDEWRTKAERLSQESQSILLIDKEIILSNQSDHKTESCIDKLDDEKIALEESLSKEREKMKILFDREKMALTLKFKRKLEKQIAKSNEEVLRIKSLLQNELRESYQQAVLEAVNQIRSIDQQTAEAIDLAPSISESRLSNDSEQLRNEDKEINGFQMSPMQSPNGANTNNPSSSIASSDMKVQPEMLSPEQTLELMKLVVKRFSNIDDLKELLLLAAETKSITRSEDEGISRDSLNESHLLNASDNFNEDYRRFTGSNSVN